MVDVEVLTPEGEVFSGEAQQVSTRSETGELGILANHAPLLAALRPTELRLHVSDSEVRRYAQAHGWLQIFGNRARLLVEEAIAPEDLDAGTLKEQLDGCRTAALGVRAGQRRLRAGSKRSAIGRKLSSLLPRDGSRGAGTPPRELSRAPCRARLRMLARPYGAQESDCISARFAHIPAEGRRLPSL